MTGYKNPFILKGSFIKMKGYVTIVARSLLIVNLKRDKFAGRFKQEIK
jgi:hypothetical protein